MVLSLVEALFAHEDGPPAARLAAVASDFDRYLSEASAALRFTLVVMLSFVRFAPLLTMGRFRAFDRLTVRDRVRVLGRMAVSPWRVLALVVAAYKAILSLLFFEHDEELEQLGYRGERRRYKRALQLVSVRAGAAG